MAVNPPSDQAGDPPADWQQQVTTLQQQLAHSNSELDRVRKEAAGYRTASRGRITRELSEMLGEPVAQDAEPPSFDDLKPRLATALTTLKAKDDELKVKDARIRSQALDLHLERAYSRHGAKGDVTRAYLDAQGHTKRLQALDPEREDFSEAVDDAVAEVLVDAPELKGSTAPIRSSAPFRPPQHFEQLGVEEVNAMEPEQVAAALRSGKLNRLLGRS